MQDEQAKPKQKGRNHSTSLGRSGAQCLLANRPVLEITRAGPGEVATKDISPARIGWKAYGLLSLPAEWVPPFFVVSAATLEDPTVDRVLNAWAATCCSRVGILFNQPVMLRSSGSAETMCNRGRLASEQCSIASIASTLEALRARIAAVVSEDVHWIVQEAVGVLHRGHLSNERRVSKEPRDWVVEFEPAGERSGQVVPIGVRNWRDGAEPPSLDLSCSSEAEITLCLRRVAMWTTRFSARAHYEWVWDGKRVRIVQVDVAEAASGMDPKSILPPKIPAIEATKLRIFRPADSRDYDRYAKLRNARLYRELGYGMPPFYVAEDRAAIRRILGGDTSGELEEDLADLTRRPLVIRTDGIDIPSEKREMLPRSEELRSLQEAKEWLCGPFRRDVQQAQLTESYLCLLAHHFIPSVASAWAGALPGNRIVRIESLWGIPEGLYWYSHDTFEVDTQNIKIEGEKSFAQLQYTSRERLRYKGTFVAPNEHGHWIPMPVLPPNDWRRSIRRRKWLFEIARTTRRIAEAAKHPVAVMWFVDNHPQASAHCVLPWYHMKSELAGVPRAAPRRKLTSTKDVHIRRVSDWEALQRDAESSKRIERVIVEPVDSELIRNPKFADDLADLAVRKQFVVELSGGILSHAYYILSNRGAQVECADLYGADEEVVEYDKVVRDKVPGLIERRGEVAETVQLRGDALVSALRQKLVEEAFEALDAKSGEDLVSELADVEEVVSALASALRVSAGGMNSVRTEKRRKRGGFAQGLMLIRTSTPHSIPKGTSQSGTVDLDLKIEDQTGQVISHAAGLPKRPLYRRPDLRQVDQQPEKLFSFATDTNKLGQVKASLQFSMRMDDGIQREFALTVELRRTGPSIRGNVRVRAVPSQLHI